MKIINNFFGLNNVSLFGVFDGSDFAFSEKLKSYNENFNDYKKYSNKLAKIQIINYIQALEPYLLTSRISKDMFTGEKLSTSGYYKDGSFMFPVQFLYYLKKYDIGIPSKYEEYITSKIV